MSSVRDGYNLKIQGLISAQMVLVEGLKADNEILKPRDTPELLHGYADFALISDEIARLAQCYM